MIHAAAGPGRGPPGRSEGPVSAASGRLQVAKSESKLDWLREGPTSRAARATRTSVASLSGVTQPRPRARCAAEAGPAQDVPCPKALAAAGLDADDAAAAGRDARDDIDHKAVGFGST